MQLSSISLGISSARGGALLSDLDPILGAGFTYANQTLALDFTAQTYASWETAKRTLVLDFSAADNSYATGAALNLDFINNGYSAYQAPAAVQGRYQVKLP